MHLNRGVGQIMSTTLRAVYKLCRLGRGEGGSPKDDLLHTLLHKKDDKGWGGGSKIAAFETT